MTTIEVPAPLGDDVLGEDWFGEGSVFDTGEELAAALLALAGAAPDALLARGPELQAGPPAVETVVAPSAAPPASGGASRTEPAAGPVGEFQVASMPSFVKPVPKRGRVDRAGWQGSPVTVSRPQASGWSIRQSVQILRTTEAILIRLREEAAGLAWEWAAAVHREVEPVSAASHVD